MNIKIFSILTLIVLAVIFILQNVEVVDVNLIFWQVKISRALLIFINLLIGFLLGWGIKSFYPSKKTIQKNFKEEENPKPDNSDKHITE